MRHQRQLFAFVVLAFVALVLGKNNYLAEKPNFLRPCRRTDADFISCYQKNFEGVFREWKNGVPGLKSFGSLDPFHLKRIGITQGDDNPLVKITMDLLNITLTGLSQTEITVVSVDLEKASIIIKIKTPKVQIESDYKIKGRLLNLPLDGNGKANILINDLNANVQLHIKLRDEFGYTFVDVDKLKLEISDIGGFHGDLQNLFNGQEELEKSTNVIINENWGQLSTILGPTIRDAVQTVVFDRIKKLYAYVPAKYFIEDIPTAAVFYG